MRVFKISGRLVGEGQLPVISAEIGLNWNGDAGLGLKLIREAAACGCDAVKFQNYRVADFVKSKKETYTWGPPGREKTETKWEMFRRYELDFETLWLFKEEADQLGLIFHSTPTGEPGLIDLLDPRIGASIVKNGSDMLGNKALIAAMAESGLTVLLSTGEELGARADKAIELFAETAGRKWMARAILLHCVSEYPTAKGKANLKRIEDLRKKWGTAVGYSDHTIGIECAVEAVRGWGACWIEKHFTLDKSMEGPDHWFSADPKEMAELVRQTKGA